MLHHKKKILQHFNFISDIEKKRNINNITKRNYMNVTQLVFSDVLAVFDMLYTSKLQKQWGKIQNKNIADKLN